jgi:hypothetical protein
MSDDRLLKAPRDLNLGLGIDWNFSSHSGLINNRGEELIHEVGMRCVCQLEDVDAGMVETGSRAQRQRYFNCSICRGDKYIFRNPQKIVALVVGIRQQKTQIESGWATPGDSMISTHIGYQISSGDLITFPWGQPVPDGQVILRGAAHLGSNSARDTGLEPNEDLLWYNAESAVWVEDEFGKKYEEGNFSLDGSKIIKWLGNKPADGTRYVIKYNAFLEWVAFTPPEIRRDRNRDLGSRVQLRLRHVSLQNKDPRPRVSDKVPFMARISG